MVKNLLKREEKNLFTMLVKDLQFFYREYFFQKFRMGRRTFEDFLSWITAIIQKSFLRRSKATPAEGLCATLLYLTFQNTSGRLLLHVADEEGTVDSHQAEKTVFKMKIPHNTVRKFWLNFTGRLVTESHVEKVC